jgi:hypothetical protein
MGGQPCSSCCAAAREASLRSGRLSSIHSYRVYQCVLRQLAKGPAGVDHYGLRHSTLPMNSRQEAEYRKGFPAITHHTPTTPTTHLGIGRRARRRERAWHRRSSRMNGTSRVARLYLSRKGNCRRNSRRAARAECVGRGTDLAATDGRVTGRESNLCVRSVATITR